MPTKDCLAGLGLGIFALVVMIGLSPSRHATASPGLVTKDLEGMLTIEQLASTLVGPGVTISNVEYIGADIAAGTFSGGAGIIGFDSGIILSSGDIANVVGPNNSDETTLDNGRLGDPDLNNLIPGFTTFDAAVLKFDFVPDGAAVTFRYVFASEEYNEYVANEFNDVFGFFINGVNFARLPDSVTPVSINNVNGGNLEDPAACFNGVDDDGDGLIDGDDPDCTTAGDNIVSENNQNSQFYINNDCSDPDGVAPCSIDIESDGLTVVLNLVAPVNAGEVNTMNS